MVAHVAARAIVMAVKGNNEPAPENPKVAHSTDNVGFG